MACACAQDLLQKLDCLATEAGQARVQHQSDQRDDCIHVGPGERQGREEEEAGLSRLALPALLQRSPHLTAAHSGPPPRTSAAHQGSLCGGRAGAAHTAGRAEGPALVHPPQASSHGFCAWLRKCRRAVHTQPDPARGHDVGSNRLRVGVQVPQHCCVALAV